jgi:glycosyltransferase involved in cell wall biosynthesis
LRDWFFVSHHTNRRPHGQRSTTQQSGNQEAQEGKAGRFPCDITIRQVQFGDIELVQEEGLNMTEPRRIAFIGNAPPRLCGIATFTSHLQHAVAESRQANETRIVAMNDHGQSYRYPSDVFIQIKDHDIQDYVRAARILNAGDYDLVCLQHEFGIFGGNAGSHILDLLVRLTMPVVTTFHTVLEKPNAAQRDVMERIIALSTELIVMANKGKALLLDVYRAPAAKISVIPHGIPDFEFVEPDAAKAKLGLAEKSVILTFGLLSPNKGIEVMIDAMPAILERKPNAVYVVLGATHPNLLREKGESYRESLVAQATRLGVQDSVVFLNQFVDQPVLLDYISACDVYVTPYLNQSQMTSGTLSYSFGLGKAVVSTPYWHAEELLADGHGVLVEFGSSAALASALGDLLTDDAKRLELRQRAYAKSRSMVWSEVAKQYLAIFENALRPSQLRRVARIPKRLPASSDVLDLPDMRYTHFLAMCDDTGLFQHSVHSIPDRLHGYCIDDNARALLLACTLHAAHEEELPDKLVTLFASFVQHAWNPDNNRFRNFMSFDRRWLEDQGSEDSHGRTLWALGECAKSDASSSRRQWAEGLFAKALAVVETFASPRAWAFTLLGLDAHCKGPQAERLRKVLAERLLSLLITSEQDTWTWFEPNLAYDNARLSQALIVTGMATHSSAYVEAGLRTLRWLMAQQTAPKGHFRPVGSASFGRPYAAPLAFDQQPLEATASISACLAAYRVDGEAFEWQTHAMRAFQWFTGSNDLQTPLVDFQTGRCRDGLHPDRVNENSGGESLVSYLISAAEIRALARASGDFPDTSPAKVSVSNVHRFVPVVRN